MSSVVADEVLRRLAHDLEAALGSTGLELRIEPASSYLWAPSTWTPPDHEICLRIDGEPAVRYGVVESKPLEPQLAQIADNMQDDVVEKLVRVWPPCPGHAHPAAAKLRSGEAVWVCPTKRNVLSRIGALPAF